MEASGSWEHEDEKSKLSLEEKVIKWYQDWPYYPKRAAAMEASGSGEHEDEKSKLSLEEKVINWYPDWPYYPKRAAAMEASGSGEHEDKRWSFLDEITKVLYSSVNLSYPEEETIRWYASREGEPHDYECLNGLMIWTGLRKNLELRRQEYSHIKVPKDIGEVIMNNLLKLAGDMIQKPSVHDFGVVAFSLSRRWLAKSIHKMLKDGIDTWAPKLPVGKVMVDFPSLGEEINMGWYRQHTIANSLIRMLHYCEVEVILRPMDEFMDESPPLQRPWGESIVIKDRGRDVVIYVEKKPPFILAKGFLNSFYSDLKALGYGICVEEADWIVYLTPVRQQEYIEMCFTAAKNEGWIKYITGKWNPGDGLEYPVLTYAGYRTYSTQELPILLEQLKDHCDMAALGEDARLLGYNDEAVLNCVLMYTCLKTHRLADCTFNFDEMVKEEGDTFVYLLHKRAEVHRITNNSRRDIDKLKVSDLILEKFEGWEESEERMLEFYLLAFTEIWKLSSLSVLPHVMCEYLYNLSEKFESYNDFVLRNGSAAESRLLLCEATAVVMERCFHLLGITPDVTLAYATFVPPMLWQQERRSRLLCDPMAVEVCVEPQKMSERELMDGTILDHQFVDYFITPCFVSDARDPSRNSRFEIFAICPLVTTDKTFKKGYLFGQIAISDKYGVAVSDWGYEDHLNEPDFPYVYLFLHEWSDPVYIDGSHAGLLYLDNPSSHHSVPFSSSIEFRMELYASTETKDKCFQLCNHKVQLDLEDIWKEESNGKCVCRSIEGKDGKTIIYGILLKDAVDASVEVKFEGNDREVHGTIFADYGDNFYDGLTCLARSYYKALLYSSDQPIRPIITGRIPLKRSVLAVPKNASLVIEAYFFDPETNDVILWDTHNFTTPTKEDSSKATATLKGTDCELTLEVVWK